MVCENPLVVGDMRFEEAHKFTSLAFEFFIRAASSVLKDGPRKAKQGREGVSLDENAGKFSRACLCNNVVVGARKYFEGRLFHEHYASHTPSNGSGAQLRGTAPTNSAEATQVDARKTTNPE